MLRGAGVSAGYDSSDSDPMEARESHSAHARELSHAASRQFLGDNDHNNHEADSRVSDSGQLLHSSSTIATDNDHTPLLNTHSANSVTATATATASATASGKSHRIRNRTRTRTNSGQSTPPYGTSPTGSPRYMRVSASESHIHSGHSHVSSHAYAHTPHDIHGDGDTADEKQRRARMVSSFIQSGEHNATFANKAPLIVTGSDSVAISHGGIDVSRGGSPLLSAIGGITPNRHIRNPVMRKRELEEDFQTVDWARDRDRYLWMKKKANDRLPSNGCLALVTRGINNAQAWIICAMVGLSTGFLAALVDIVVHWMSDLKLGYCKRGFWLDYAFCCHAGELSDPIKKHCSDWQLWDEAISSSLSNFDAGYLFYVIIGVAAATMSAWLVSSFAPYAAGSGIPEVKTMLGGVIIKRFLGLWTLLIKGIGLVLSVGSGLSLGKEGPYVHIAACCANIYSRWFSKFKDNQAKKNEMVSAAAAAGVSVAFGAPVGGVLFSLEEASTYFPHKTMWRAFFAAIIASLTLKYMDPLQTGKLVLFQIDYNVGWAWFEMLPFLVLGVFGGIIGVVFIRLNIFVARLRKHTRLGNHPVLDVAMLALITSLIKFNSDFLRGSNNNVLAAFFRECDPMQDTLHLCEFDTAGTAMLNMFMTAVVTIFLTVFTFGAPVPAGLFIPSLLTGAALGRMLGTMMRVLHHEHPDSSLFSYCTEAAGSDCITPGIYALVGAAAVLGGVTRVTISLVVIMFELTGGLSYILPIMVAAIVSKWVGDAFGRAGIYDEYIELHSYPYLEGDATIPLGVRAEDVMTTDLMVLTMHGHTVASLMEQLEVAKRLNLNGFPVVTSTTDMLVVGYITRAELEHGLRRALRKYADVHESTRCYFAMLDLRFPKNDSYVDLRPWLHPTPIQVIESTPLHRIYDIFQQLGLRYCLVTRFGKIIGIITKKDMLTFFQEHEH
jgi:chloride channel 3/4/5